MWVRDDADEDAEHVLNCRCETRLWRWSGIGDGIKNLEALLGLVNLVVLVQPVIYIRNRA